MAESTDSVTWGWNEYFAQLSETWSASLILQDYPMRSTRPDVAGGGPGNSDQVLHRFRDRIVELRRLIVSLRVHNVWH